MALWRVAGDDRTGWAVGSVEEGPRGLLPEETSLASLLAGDAPFIDYRRLPVQPVPPGWRPVTPLDRQEVWAAGVTFVESRYAREAESTAPDFYRSVYFADRPELFPKAAAGTVMGPGAPIGIRADSAWSVPEPELGIVVDAGGSVVAVTVGNDVSSRSIEGENPLYLPQAKVYDRSCAVGPCLVPLDEAPPIYDIGLHLRVERAGAPVFEGHSSLAQLKRAPAELARWLFAARSFPPGVVLLCGTSIVPPPEFTLREEDRVVIEVPGVGTLVNQVTVVGSDPTGGSVDGGDQ